MRTLEDFPRSEWRDSTEKLRRIDSSNAAKVGFKDIYWTVPFLIRLIDRIDEKIADDPREALGLAEPLPRLAQQIPVQCSVRRGIVFYESPAEAHDFLTWSVSVLTSALRSAGKHSDACFQSDKALELADSASPVVRAEALRRVANLVVDLGEFERAKAMLGEAIQIFGDLEDAERLALSLVSVGNIRNLTEGAGSGSLDYANAIYSAASARTPRADRVIIAAASNLAMDAARVPTTRSHDIFDLIQAATNAMKGRALGVPKLMIQWARAVVAYRFGLGRYTVRWLERVRDGLLKRGALPDGIVCITDLLTIARDYEPERLSEIAAESLRAVQAAVEDSTPDDKTAAIITMWSKQPTDVEVLLRHWGRDRAVISRQA